MPRLLRNVLAILLGFAIGAVVNSSIVALGQSIVAPLAGVNVHDTESLNRAIEHFEPRHFAMPFLAHALGTLAGALAAYLIAANYKVRMAYAIGILFLCAGVAASFMIRAPAWFVALDLLAAYLPMAWLATRIGAWIRPPASA
jgi:hypothetical protein